MVIDYTLEPFWVPDLHPRSEERPSKSGRVPDFLQNYKSFGKHLEKKFTFERVRNVLQSQEGFLIFVKFLDVSQCFRGFGNFFKFIFLTHFSKVNGKISEIFENKIDFFFYIFQCLWIFWGVWELLCFSVIWGVWQLLFSFIFF